MQKAEGKTTSRALTVDDGVIKHLQVWFDVAVPEVEHTLRNAENVDDDGHHHRGKVECDGWIELSKKRSESQSEGGGIVFST